MNFHKSASALEIAFASSFLDRAEHVRRESQQLQLYLHETNTKILPFWQGKPLIQLDSQQSGVSSARAATLGWLNSTDLFKLIKDYETCIFLGLDPQGYAHFAIDLSLLREQQKTSKFATIGKFIDARTIAPNLDAHELGVLAQARSMLEWHKTHRFCACCGLPTELNDGGYRRHCNQCHADHFPRTDPVVIMLVYCAERCLLGRKSTFPSNLFSCLAGFMEPGESIEEAVAREVQEEASVSVEEVCYVASQPWPFPSQLMIGCLAKAQHTNVHASDELEEIRWFSRTEIVAILQQKDTTFMVPPSLAIAHQLIRYWALEMNSFKQV